VGAGTGDRVGARTGVGLSRGVGEGTAVCINAAVAIVSDVDNGAGVFAVVASGVDVDPSEIEEVDVGRSRTIVGVC